MSINVSQSFHRTSANAVDDTLTLTKAEMLAVNDNLMPGKYLSVCQDDGELYLYDKSATPNLETGKFKKYGGGHAIEDEDGTALTQREILQFGEGIDVSDDATNEKTVVDVKPLDTGDIDDIVFPLPDAYHPATKCGFTPVGTIIAVMGNVAPVHYLACDGQNHQIVDYPELAAYIEEQFGSMTYFGGDGDTFFGVPDLRGEFLRGTGTNSRTNQGSGAAVGVHQNATGIVEMAVNNNSISALYAGTVLRSYELSPDTTYKVGSDSVNWTTATASSTATGATTTVATTRPTNTSVLYCIATKDIYIDARYDYSTDEKVVGKWLDGKNLYQRTYVLDAITGITDGTTAEFRVDTGFTVNDVGVIYLEQAFCRTSTGKTCYKMNDAWTVGTQTYFLRCSVETNTNVSPIAEQIVVRCNRSTMSSLIPIVTIRYTKI